MIRLDATLLQALPLRTKADSKGPYAARVNCVLHSGPLSEAQELTVSINKRSVVGMREGDQFVFAWQLLNPAEEVRITLHSHARPVRYWLGGWNGRDAIVHTGSLPVHIFFDGKRQPEAEMFLLATNGTTQLVHSLNGTVATVGNDDEQESIRPSTYAEPERAEMAGEAKKEQMEGEIDPPYGDMQVVRAKEQRAHDDQEHATNGRITGSRLIAFCASDTDGRLHDLQQLMAGMPAKTLIVDVRPRRVKNQSLAKSQLQHMFGAKYADRSWMRFRVQPTTGCYVVEEPVPDELLSLAQKLEQGYALVVLDHIALYEQSLRRAVIDELQRRVPSAGFILHY
jgi:hypothetical protein